MNPIAPAEISAIQAEAAAALDKSCAIQRGTRTPKASGGASVAFSTIHTVNAGMTEPTAGALQNYQYLVGDLATWMIRFPVGTDVLEEDRLIINGETLTVKKILAPRSYPILLTVLATEVK